MQIPLCLAIFVLSMGGFGVWGVMRHWRFLVETQLRLNQCVGRSTLDFKDTLNSIRESNSKIVALRVALAAAELRPELIPPLKIALNAVVISQDLKCTRWEAKRWRWLLSKGCGERGDWALPLPKLEVRRDPPDHLGPQVLRWSGEQPDEFKVFARHRPRAMSAVVIGGSIDASVNSSQWKAQWIHPGWFTGAARTNFY